MLRQNIIVVVSIVIKSSSSRYVDDPVEQSNTLTLQQSSTYAFLNRYGNGATRSSECALSYALH